MMFSFSEGESKVVFGSSHVLKNQLFFRLGVIEVTQTEKVLEKVQK